MLGVLTVILSVLASAHGKNYADRGDFIGFVETAIENAENSLLVTRQFYGNELGKLNMIYQLAGNRCENVNRETELFKLIPASMFLRSCQDFDFIVENESRSNTVDELFLIEKNATALPWPTLVILEDEQPGMILHGSRLINDLDTPRPVLYLHNEHEIGSKEIISTLIEAGYEVFWHIPVPDTLPNEFLESNEVIEEFFESLHIRLVAIPLERSRTLVPATSSRSGMYAFKPGAFYFSQYNVNVSIDNSTGSSANISLLHDGNDEMTSSSENRNSANVLYSRRLKQKISPPLRLCSSCAEGVAVHHVDLKDVKLSDFFLTVNVDIGLLVRDISERRGGDYVNEAGYLKEVPHDMVLNGSVYTTAAISSSQKAKSINSAVFPRALSCTGEAVYLSYYCDQVSSKYNTEFPWKMQSTCEVYLAHMLREEESFQKYLTIEHSGSTSADFLHKSESTSTVVSSLPAFNSWRGAEDTDGIPGVSIRRNDSELCTEPIYCELGRNMQADIVAWQNPSQDSGGNRKCYNSKFLVMLPTFKWSSIGSWIHQIAILLRYAMCHDRILLLPSKGMLQNIHEYWRQVGIPEGDSRLDFTPHMRWIHDKCSKNDSVIDCYFQPLSSCRINEAEYFETFHIFEGTEVNLEDVLMSSRKYVSVSFIPFSGSCAVGASSWHGSFNFFRGKNVGLAKYAQLTKRYEWGDVHKEVAAAATRSESYGAFAGEDDHPLKSQLMRYILRPKRWFANALSVAIQNRLSNNGYIPRPFANLHVRYGEKVLEMDLVPLRRYMKVLMKKAPHIRDVFVTTETEEVFHNLTRDFPDRNFYYTRFERNTHLHTSLKEGHVIDYQMDFFMSMSNLFVSIEADFFVGTLASGWCQMINELQRTRGDGGTTYNAVDSGPL